MMRCMEDLCRGGVRVGAAAVLGLVALATGGCSGESEGGGTSSSDGGTAVTDTRDQRADVLAEIGAPDAFVLQVSEVDGDAVRYESWTYFDAGTQIDFLDGEVLWDIEIDPVADGALLPLLWSPVEFDLLASRADTVEGLDGIELTEVDGSELDIDGAEILAGEQLVLAFVDDQLVYAESYVLAPGEQEVE